MEKNLQEYSRLSDDEIKERIQELKEEKNAVVLAHNYQRLEVQSVGDYLGDSLGLSKKAANTEADIIVFAGVTFMAETAKILSPDKTVLIPDINAGCPLADFADVDSLQKKKEEYPDYSFLAYVNTAAEVKSMVDICCTSSNAEDVVKHIEGDKVVFLPDKNLASFTQKQVEKEILPWEGHCYVHNQITPEDIREAREENPDSTIIVHPECPPEVSEMSDIVGSTGDMVRYVENHPDEDIILGTEIGLAKRMQKEHPDQNIRPLKEDAVCKTMKKITLPKVLWALENEKWKITIPDKVLEGAKEPLERMVNLK